MSTLVSIIIPTYNYGAYLARAVESCLSQTHRDVEIIVIDDGSTDNTRAVMRRFLDRVTYVYQENRGVSAARNVGLEMASGDFITFLDSDDYLVDDALATRLDALSTYPEVACVITETYSQEAGSDTLSWKPQLPGPTVSDRFYEQLLTRRFPFQVAATLTRAHVAKRFRYPEDLSNGEDVAYFTKIFFSEKVLYLPVATSVSVRHMDSLRHDIDEIRQNGAALVDVIVKDPFYGGALDYLDREFRSFRSLSLFRRLYQAGEMHEARQHYFDVLRSAPVRALKPDYVAKLIKSYFR